jgi:hypothetical protein
MSAIASLCDGDHQAVEGICEDRPRPVYLFITREDGLFFSYLLSLRSFDGKRVRSMLRALDKLVNREKRH